MSNAIFPTSLNGMKLFSNRTPVFKTSVQEAQSGKETRIQRMAYPRFKWEVSFDLLRDDVTPSDFRTFMGFFASAYGQLGTFLYTDPYWNTVTAMQFGTGDGSTTAFQVTATNGAGGYGIPEIIQNFNGAPSIYVGGVLKTSGTDYTLGATGIVTFTAAPASAAVITWTGSFYYRCRFTTDELGPSEVLKKWWSLKSCVFTSVKL